MESGWCAPAFLHVWLVSASFFMQNYMNDIPECRNDTLLPELGMPKFTQKEKPDKKNTTYHGAKTMASH